MKFMTFWIALLLCVPSIQAANIHDLDIGDGVYLQGFLSDELVYVLRIDIGSNRVKIRRSEDGTTKWVNPSKLISRETSIGNDVGRTAAGIAIAVCALNPDACKNTGNNNSQRNSLQSNNSSTAYKFKITNDCRHSIRIALHYKKMDGNWNTVGWWSLGGNKYRYLTFQDGSYATTKNSIFYYYAEASDKSFYWGGGKNNYSVDGKTFAMLRVEDKSGDSELTLNCAGR